MSTKFNKTQLAALIKSALGKRTQKEFAAQVQIRPEHLSRILNCHYDTPPSVDTLKRIALNSDNNISYHALLSACGYVLDKDTDYSLPTQASSINRKVIATILTSLDAKDYAWTRETIPANIPCHLLIRINEPFVDCLFYYINPNLELGNQEFNSILFHLLFTAIDVHTKYFFVTSSESEYKKFSEYNLNNLNMNISIILIDTEFLCIRKEAIISRSTNPIKNLFL